MSTSAKLSEKKSTADIAVEQYVTKTRSKAKASTEEEAASSKFADIKSNMFHKITLQSDFSPEEKSKAVAKALTYDAEKSKEENDAQIAAFEEFKSYLMERRKDMSKEIIRLSDTEAFSELQSVLQDMNTGLLNFENDIKPLIEIIDAIHRLNIESGGAMYDVFKEVEEDRAEEKRLAELRELQEKQLDEFNRTITTLNEEINVLREDKSFFGFGSTKKSALREIERKKTEIDNTKNQITGLREEIENTVSERKTSFGHLAHEKAKLRELLDITSDEHRERQKALVKSATDFVVTTEEKTGSVLKHMEAMKGQIGNIDKVNGQMRRVFTIVTEGIKDAEGNNSSLVEDLKAPAENETSLQQLDREDKLEYVNRHVDSLNSSKVNTLATLGELQEESMNIKSMNDTNSQQIAKTQQMHAGGTAGVASRLTMVLSAVSSAALNESSTSAENTLAQMNAMTRNIAQSEAIQNATNIHLQNDKLMEAIEQLKSYKDVSDKATQIARAGLEEQKTRQRELEETAAALADSVKQAKGVTADVLQADSAVASSEPEERVADKPGQFEL